MRTFSVEYGGVSNLALFLTHTVSGRCPEEMVELNTLVELPVVELTNADRNNCNYYYNNVAIKHSGFSLTSG